MDQIVFVLKKIDSPSLTSLGDTDVYFCVAAYV